MLAAHLAINLTDRQDKMAFALAVNIKDELIDVESIATKMKWVLYQL